MRVNLINRRLRNLENGRQDLDSRLIKGGALGPPFPEDQAALASFVQARAARPIKSPRNSILLASSCCNETTVTVATSRIVAKGVLVFA